MTKNNAISSVSFIGVMLTSKQIPFRAVRLLRNANEQFSKLKTELDELEKVEAEDKEQGIKDFLKEEVEFIPIAAELFDNVEGLETGAFLTNAEGKQSEQSLTFIEVLMFLEKFEVIK